MAAPLLRRGVGRFREIQPWFRTSQVHSTSQGFAEVLRLPKDQVTKLVFPLQDLQRHLVQDSKSCFHLNIFDPKLEDISRAESFFTATATNHIDYVSSAVRLDHAPNLSRPEVRLANDIRSWRRGRGFCCQLLSCHQSFLAVCLDACKLLLTKSANCFILFMKIELKRF